MEILNNRQLLKYKRKAFFHYRLKDHSFPDDQKNPATIDYFSMAGNDLILTHKKYYGSKLDATDSLRDWKLINVDMSDRDPKKLSRLIKDRDISEIKMIETKNGKKLIFYSDTEVYVFRCEEIEQEVRGYSHKEIADMFLENEEILNEIDKQSSKMYDFVTRLGRFINRETTDHQGLFAMHQDNNILLATKSMHYLEILTRVKNKIDELKSSLPEDMLKYHGILV